MPMSSPLAIAPNLALDTEIRARQQRGEPVLHLGFGESRLPLLPELAERLSAGAARTDYGPVAGGTTARAAVAGYYQRRGLPTDPNDIVLAPGSKPLLLALLAAFEGDVVLPAPAWVTYEPQARLLGRGVLRVPIPAEVGGVPDPALLPDAVARFRAEGGEPTVLILTLPDNPTGTTADGTMVREVMAAASEQGLVVIADEIYRDVIFDGGADFVSPAEVVPDTTIVVTGLSKSLALGGWRIGAARFPASAVGEQWRTLVTGVASQIWSNAAGPMQSVVEYAFAEPPELVEYRTASTRLHGILAREVHRIFARHGIPARQPTGGFYVYPDFAPLRSDLARRGVGGSASLQDHLLHDAGIAVLGGHAFGDDPLALRVRVATSMLYGNTAQEQWDALRSDDPPSLPHVAQRLSMLDAGLAHFH
jgi:aspartate aminotransferase